MNTHFRLIAVWHNEIGAPVELDYSPNPGRFNLLIIHRRENSRFKNAIYKLLQYQSPPFVPSQGLTTASLVKWKKLLFDIRPGCLTPPSIFLIFPPSPMYPVCNTVTVHGVLEYAKE